MDQTISTLMQARQRAEKLLGELLQQQAELDANPPSIPADKLIQGRAALQNAIAAARRMVQSLDAALAVPRKEQN